MKKNIKTTWNGKIALHEKYIKSCLQSGTGLELFYTGTDERYKGQRMTLTPDEVRKGELGKEVFPERQGFGVY